MEQEKQVNSLPLLGDDAPAFTAETSRGVINFPEDYKGKWVILFSHPSDFTPVCTTEFMTFADYHDKFKELNTELIGLSVDSVASHIAWARDIESIDWEGKTGRKIEFPIIADLSMDVSSKYGMIQPNQSSTAAVRAVFVIDDKGKIRTILYYPLSLGRNFDELVRIVQGLQKADEGYATPADWEPGKPVIVPTPGDQTEASKRYEENPDKLDCKSWYLCLKEDN